MTVPRATAPRPARSSTTGFERVVLALFGVLRLGTVIQLTTAAIVMGGTGQMPLTSWVMSAVAAMWSIGLYVVAVRRGSFLRLSVWWGVVDILIACAAIVVTNLELPDYWQVGTWHAWYFGYVSVVAPTIPAWLRSRTACVATSVGIGLIYVASVLPGNADLASTVALNALSFVIFTAVGAILIPPVRRLMAESDANSDRAIRLATELERSRYQFHIHNATGLLAQLARDDTPPELMPSLRAQAMAESNRLRKEALRPPGEDPADQESCSTLEQAVQSAVLGFGHLPLEIRTALGRGVCLRPLDATILRSAIISLLYNVEFHAHASEVVVHTDYDGSTWEVSVCDDGVGFDPDRTAYGFGLQSQVLDSARRADMSVKIVSHPGEGTCVYIRGDAPPHDFADIWLPGRMTGR
jgi:hypothetical protein